MPSVSPDVEIKDIGGRRDDKIREESDEEDPDVLEKGRERRKGVAVNCNRD